MKEKSSDEVLAELRRFGELNGRMGRLMERVDRLNSGDVDLDTVEEILDAVEAVVDRAEARQKDGQTRVDDIEELRKRERGEAECEPAIPAPEPASARAVYLPGGFEPEAVVTCVDGNGTVRSAVFPSLGAARRYLGAVYGSFGFASMQRLVTVSTVDALDPDVSAPRMRPAPGEWPVCRAEGER